MDISSGALLAGAQRLKKTSTRVTQRNGRVLYEGEEDPVDHQEESLGFIISDTLDTSGADSATGTVELDLMDSDPSELRKKAAWMMKRNRMGNGFSAGNSSGKRVGVFMLQKKKNERHYDQLAFLWHEFAHVEQIDTADIVAGGLDSLDVVVFPGASIFEQFPSLGDEGNRRVADYVFAGGNFLGFCAGGFLCTAGGFDGAENAKRMVDADTSWTPGLGTAHVVCTSAAASVFGAQFAEGAKSSLYFANGPHFRVGASADKGYSFGGDFLPWGSVTPLLMYREVHTTIAKHRTEFGGYDCAAFSATFGVGKLVSFGPHPEASSDGWHSALEYLITVYFSSESK